ncbi:MAG: hypothetical protein ACK4UN_14815, partial [Limisphaerales bacterium]
MRDLAAFLLDGVVRARPRAGVVEGYRTVAPLTLPDVARVEL